MKPIKLDEQAPVPPPAYHRARARQAGLHIDAVTLVTTLHLLALCQVAVGLAHWRCPPPLPAGPGGAPRRYSASAAKPPERRCMKASSCSRSSSPSVAAVGHAPAHHPRPLLRGYRVHTLLCRGSGLPVFYLLSPANVHDAPFAQPLLDWAVRLFPLRPRIIRLDAAYWGLRLIHWTHGVLGAVAVVPWNPKRQKQRFCLPPTWTKEELGKRTSIERFFGRVFLFFHLQRPPLSGWSALATRVALTYTASIVVALAAQHAGRPDLIRSPKRVLAHCWEALDG